MLRIGIVVGEPSGDVLAAGLVAAVREKKPDILIEGILGPRLIEAGGNSIFSMDKLSVMGITEVFSAYLELANIRNRLKHHFLRHPPDIFIGVDAPDFNLDLEEGLRNAGIKTLHYVSPSVWAWRRGRVRKVARAADMLLTLFPFETDFYEGLELDVECVGHPLADSIPVQPDTGNARHVLDIPKEKQVVALMPGSRLKEISRHAPPFLMTASACHESDRGLLFITNSLDEEMDALMQSMIDRHAPGLPIRRYIGCSRKVLQASDVALLASGTVTLEAMLLKKPMVIGYILSALTYTFIRALASTKWAGLPNILAQDTLVPEYFQSDVNPEKLMPAVMHWLNDHQSREYLLETFRKLHESMRLGANERAADALLKLCNHRAD